MKGGEEEMGATIEVIADSRLSDEAAEKMIFSIKDQAARALFSDQIEAQMAQIDVNIIDRRILPGQRPVISINVDQIWRRGREGTLPDFPDEFRKRMVEAVKDAVVPFAEQAGYSRVNVALRTHGQYEEAGWSRRMVKG